MHQCFHTDRGRASTSLLLYPPASRLTLLFPVELLSLHTSGRENLAHSHSLGKNNSYSRQASLQWQSERSRDVCLPGLVSSKRKDKTKIKHWYHTATVHLFLYMLIVLHWSKANLPWECCSCGVTLCQVVEVTAVAEPSTAELQKGQSLACFAWGKIQPADGEMAEALMCC